MSVTDVGARTGYFTIPSAVVVGKNGHVYAVEPDSKRSDRIRQRVAKEGLGNVDVLSTPAENLADIPSGSTDLAFSAFSFHHIANRHAFLAEIRRILRNGGTFYLWDETPGIISKWGTKPEDLDQIANGFTSFEPLETRKTIRARFMK